MITIIECQGVDKEVADAFKKEFEEKMKEKDAVIVTNFQVIIQQFEVAEGDDVKVTTK